MTEPTPPLVDEAKLAAYLSLEPGESAGELAPVAGAVESLLTAWFGPPAIGWPDHVRHGALMLGARIYRRRNSPAGVEAMNELGVAYVQRNDPDLAMLLGIGSYKRPQVG